MLEFTVKKEQANQHLFFSKSLSNTWELNQGFFNSKDTFIKRLDYLLNFVYSSSDAHARKIKKNLIFFNLLVSNLCILNNALLFKLQKYGNILDFNFTAVISDFFYYRGLRVKEERPENLTLLKNYDEFLREKNKLLRFLKQKLLHHLISEEEIFLSTDHRCCNLQQSAEHPIFHELYRRFLYNLSLNIGLKGELIGTFDKSKMALTLNVYEFIVEILFSHLHHKRCLIQPFLLALETFRPFVKDLYNVIDRCCIYNLLLDLNIGNLSAVDYEVFQKTRTKSQSVLKSAGLKPFSSTEYKFFFESVPLDAAAKFTFPLEVNELESFYNCSTLVLWHNFQDFLHALESYFLNFVIIYSFSFK